MAPTMADSTHATDSLMNKPVNDTRVNTATTNSTVNPSANSATNGTVAPMTSTTGNSTNKEMTNHAMDSSNVTTNSTRHDAALPGRVMNANGLQNGLQKSAALPVLNTYVPGAIVTQLKNQYGEKLYDITMLKTGQQQYAYAFRTQENGVYKSEVVGDNGAAINKQ